MYVPLHPGRDDRAPDRAQAEEGEHQADRGGRGAELLRPDDQREDDRAEGEVGTRDEKDCGPQERLAPQPDDTLGDLRAQARWRSLPFLLKRGPHEQQGDEGDRVGDRVRGERQQPAEPEERSAQRLADEVGALDPGLVLGDRGRQLLLRNDLRQRRRLREGEEHEQRALDERDGEDLRERERVCRQCERETPQRDRSPRVGDQHHALAVPAVDQRAGRKVEEHVREGLGEPDEARPRGRVRLREHEERKRHAGDARPDGGDDLPAPEQDEVAVTPERSGRYRRRPFLARSSWRRI